VARDNAPVSMVVGFFCGVVNNSGRGPPPVFRKQKNFLLTTVDDPDCIETESYEPKSSTHHAPLRCNPNVTH
jgi:hypothetical protein